MKRADWNKFTRGMDTSDWAPVFATNNIDESWEQLQSKINACFADAVPLREASIRKWKEPPWMTKATTKAFNIKQNAYRNYKRNQNDETRAAYKNATNRLKFEIKTAVIQFERKIAFDPTDSKRKFWSYVRQKQIVRQQIGHTSYSAGIIKRY